MSKEVLFSPAYIDEEGYLGRDFYDKLCDFGRLKIKGDFTSPNAFRATAEINFLDRDWEPVLMHTTKTSAELADKIGDDEEARGIIKSAIRHLQRNRLAN